MPLARAAVALLIVEVCAGCCDPFEEDRLPSGLLQVDDSVTVWRDPDSDSSRGVGWLVGGGADFDGDDGLEILIASHVTSAGGERGAIHICAGELTGVLWTDSCEAAIRGGTDDDDSLNHYTSFRGADIDGDGIGDVAVAYARGLAVYYGPFSGDWSMISPDAFRPNTDRYVLATDTFVANDLTGDGLADLAVKVQGVDQDGGEESLGRAIVVVPGPLAGSDWDGDETLVKQPLDSDNLLEWVADGGDIDGDGPGDLLVGTVSSGDVHDTRVHVLYGPASRWTSTDAAESVILDLTGFTSVAGSVGLGDIDADGYGDIVIDSPFGALLLYGPLVGETQPETGAYLPLWDRGFTAAGVGDLNGDGYDEFVITEADQGNRTAVVFGRSCRLDTVLAWEDIRGVVMIKMDSLNYPAPYSNYYTATDAVLSVARAGDLDGDGLGDFVLGIPALANPSLDPPLSWAGEARVFLGGQFAGL